MTQITIKDKNELFGLLLAYDMSIRIPLFNCRLLSTMLNDKETYNKLYKEIIQEQKRLYKWAYGKNPNTFNLKYDEILKKYITKWENQ